MRRMLLLVSVVVIVGVAVTVMLVVTAVVRGLRLAMRGFRALRRRLVVAAFVSTMRLVMTMSCLIQGLKVDDEDPPPRLQNAPDFADGSPENLGCQVVHDQTADYDIHRGICKW